MINHTLVAHSEIQLWASEHRGQPAIRRVPDMSGTIQSELHLKFDGSEGRVGDGLSPVSWAAWLAELDRQNLAVKVGRASRFELVDRGSLN